MQQRVGPTREIEISFGDPLKKTGIRKILHMLYSHLLSGSEQEVLS